MRSLSLPWVPRLLVSFLVIIVCSDVFCFFGRICLEEVSLISECERRQREEGLPQNEYIMRYEGNSNYQFLMAVEDLPNPKEEETPRSQKSSLIPHSLISQQALLFIWCLLMQAHCLYTAETVICTRPDAESLYNALEIVFNRSSFRPVISLKTPTNISVGFTLFGILGVDEKAQLLMTYIWLELIWKIEYVSWDPIQCGATRISLPREKLWMSDVLINEFMDEDRSPNIPYVYLNHTGHVTDSRPVRVVSSCNLDIYTFPFDIQNCTYTFNPYLHLASDIQMHLGESFQQTLLNSNEVITTMGEWELVDIRAYEKNPGEHELENGYGAVIYHIALRRRPTLYVVNLLLPSCFLITVDLFSFLLPPQNVDRASFKMTLILGYTVFLLIMNDTLPVTGNRIPLLNVFFSICLALMVASLIETVVITNILYSSNNYTTVPHWVHVLVLQYLARLVCLGAKKPSKRTTIKLNPTAQGKDLEAPSCLSVTAGDKLNKKAEVFLREPELEELKNLSRDLSAIREQVENHLTSKVNEDEWTLVGNVIDRLLFSLYTLFIVISLITISVVWINWYIHR